MSDNSPPETLPDTGMKLVRQLEHLWQCGPPPDVHEFLAEAGAVTPAETASVLGVDQWQRWRAGERVPAEDYLHHYPALVGDPEHALELVYAEFLIRESQGESPTLEEYQRRFPLLADRLRQRVEVHRGRMSADTATNPDTRTTLPYHDPNGEPSAPPGGPAVAGSSRYRPLSLHARGGLGEVHLAEDTELGRKVALKRIRPEFASIESCRRRFLREAEITALLEHPGIVPVHGLVLDAEGQPNYVMRFVSGESLRAAIDRYHQARRAGGDSGHPLEFRQLLRRFVDVCNTVGYAHSKGVIHRDLKPDNVMLGEFGETLIVDWGLAKILDRPEFPDADGEPAGIPTGEPVAETTEPGRAMGTPAYMAPEQASGRWEVVGPRSDIYSLGATLACLLTGQPPVRGKTTGELLVRVQRGELVRPRDVDPGVPAALEAVCLKALALRPEERYGTARELATEVERWLSDEPVAAYREPWTVRAQRWARRHRVAVAGAGAAMLVALLSLTGWTILQDQHSRALRQANENERAQREVADDNYRLARESVERYFKRVSQNRRLKDQGLYKLRQELLRDAGEFYRRFLDKHAGEAGLERDLADAYFQTAQIQSELGDNRQALKACLQALDLRRRLAEQDPEAASIRGELAKTCNNTGMFFRLTGNNKEAEAHLQEARRIYGALAEQHPDTAEHQVGLAASFNNLGLLYRSTGNFAQAEFHHKEGLKIDRDMTGRYPDVVLYQRRLGQTYHNMGLMYTEFDKIAQAEDCYREALTVKERLAVQHSDDEYQHDLILSHLNLALVYLDHGKDKEAVPLFEKALALLQGLSERHPEISAYQNQMSRAQRGLADCYDNLGRAPDAERHYKEALAIIQRLADRYPEVGEHRSDLARCHNNFAGFYYAAGEHLRAEPHYRKALALREVLARDNPEITWNQRDLAESHSNMGLLLHALALPRRDARQFQESEDHFRKALVIQESLSQRQPGHLDMATDLAATHEKLGNLQLNRGQLDEAVTLYAKAIHLLEDILAKESGRADARGHLGIARGKRAAALVKLSRYGEALPDLERALALADGPAREDLRVRIADCLVRTGAHARAVTEVEALANPKSPAPTLYNLACVYALSAAAAVKDAKLSNGERARLAEKYSARAVVLLGDARKAGFFKEARSIDHMKKDTDLDPLRGREDYRKLLAELERK